ncbi:MAG: hypothetical protein AAF636_28025 [Pseudomonadota bacterium]
MPTPKTDKPRSKTVSVALTVDDYDMLTSAAEENNRKLSSEVYARLKLTMDLFGTQDVFEVGSAMKAAQSRMQLMADIRREAELLEDVPLLVPIGSAEIRGAFGRRGMFGRSRQRERRRRISSPPTELSNLFERAIDSELQDLLASGIVVCDYGDESAYSVGTTTYNLQMETDLIFDRELSEAISAGVNSTWDELSPLMKIYDDQFADVRIGEDAPSEVQARAFKRWNTALVSISDLLEWSLDYALAKKWALILDEVSMKVAVESADDMDIAVAAKLAKDQIQSDMKQFRERYYQLRDWFRDRQSTQFHDI